MHRLYYPPPPLAAFVRCFWYWEGVPQPHAHERLMPTGEATIVFSLRDEQMRIYDADELSRYRSCGTVALAGPRLSPFAIETPSEDRIVGIEFLPGGTFPFFRPPASELTNQSLALEQLWRGTAGDLREQLIAAPSVEAQFTLLEQNLLAQLARPLELHPAVRFARRSICRAPHTASVSRLLERIGLSQRRFIQLFHDQVGLSPKAFCRVRRFQRVLATVHRRPAVDWAQVALDGGYYDQAHLIHEFQSLSGLTPSVYLARSTEHLNHVPI